MLTLFWLSSWADPAGGQGIWKIRLAVSLEILVRTSHDKRLVQLVLDIKIKTTTKRDVSPPPLMTELSGSAHDHVTSFLTCIAGLCGNILTLMVTSGRAYRRTAHGIYITTMAVADIAFLLTQPLNRAFVHDLFGWDIRTHSVIGCKIYFFFLRWARPMSALVIVLICIERFVAIWLPLRAKIISSRRNALFQVCGIFSLACFVSGFRVQTVGITNDLCIGIVSTPDNKHLITLCSFMGLTIRTLIPTITLLVLTPPTVAKLFYQRRLRRVMSQGNQSDETFRVSMMLLAVAVAFCVLVTPFCLSKHWYLLAGTKVYLSSATWMKSLNEIRQICEQMNCVINFFLYVFISRQFRNQFRVILTCQDGQTMARGSAQTNRSDEKCSVKTVSQSTSKGQHIA